MSIGKSSIKRAANNGYSNVKSAAPDMENSVVAEEVKAPVVEAPAPVVEAPAPAKKKPAAKKAAPKKACAPKAAGKVAEKGVSLGQDLPYYLL